jgi:nucleotide-binding universal stress UspA family protein
MMLPPAPVKEVLVATDFSDEADGALRFGAAYARATGARLHVFHVLSSAEVEVARLLADATAEVGAGVAVTVASAYGDPGTEILRYAGAHAIDLIVVGTHGRTGFSRVILGSVADRVLRGARCPVLVIPSRALAPAAAAPAAREAGADGDVLAPPMRTCLVCAQPTPDLVCAGCRAGIRAEALERKQREERAGHR